MIEIVPFAAEHIDQLNVDEERREPGAKAASFGDAWTAMLDGCPIGCGGLVEIWPGRAYAWAILGNDSGPYMRSITKAVIRGFEISDYPRIEIAVHHKFKAGRHWARLLGFTLETPEPARCYMPDGSDAYLYSRCK